MANFKNMEMAAALSQQPYITIKSTLFGISKKAIYTPTNSPLKPDFKEYTPEHGTQVEHLLSLPTEKLVQELQANKFPTSTPVGQYRLEVCISADNRFAALQLFRFSEFSYRPASELLTFTDTEAETICNSIK